MKTKRNPKILRVNTRKISPWVLFTHWSTDPIVLPGVNGLNLCAPHTHTHTFHTHFYTWVWGESLFWSRPSHCVIATWVSIRLFVCLTHISPVRLFVYLSDRKADKRTNWDESSNNWRGSIALYCLSHKVTEAVSACVCLIVYFFSPFFSPTH